MTSILDSSSTMRWTPLVLLVDPREAERVQYGNQLRQRGFSVLEAIDGEEALWIARDFIPDLICIDLVVSKLDAFTLVERLKAIPLTATIRVLAVTTMSYGGVLTHARAVGCDRILTRPCPPERLAAEVAELLGWPGGYRKPTGGWCTGTAEP
jgi:CheY-like chemotaxis protein